MLRPDGVRLSPNGLAIGLVVVALFGASEVRRFEREAARELRSRVEGEKAVVRVTTRGEGLFGHVTGDLASVKLRASAFSTKGLPLFVDPGLPTDGKIDRFVLQLDDFVLAGLRVERLRATIPDCRFDFGQAKRKREIAFSRSGVGQGTVVLLERDLESFLVRKHPRAREVRLRLADGLATMEGRAQVLGSEARFHVRGKLEPREGVRLVLVEPDVTINGEPAGEAATGLLLSVVNPVVDLNRDLNLYGAIEVDSLAIEDGRLVAQARARIPMRPNSG